MRSEMLRNNTDRKIIAFILNHISHSNHQFCIIHFEFCIIKNFPAYNKIAHPHLNLLNIRFPRSQLRNGNLAAHAQIRLMLLGSPPDMVHGSALRKTVSSTPLSRSRRYSDKPGCGDSSLL